MSFDYSSLLLALAFAGTCLAVTLFATWLSARSERFLLTWSLGVTFIVGQVFVYGIYVRHANVLFAIGSFFLLILGLVMLYVAAVQFRKRTISLTRKVALAVVALVVALGGFATGMDGVGFILANLVAMALLFATAWQYAQVREDVRGAVLGLTILYSIVGVSFALCAIVLIADGAWYLGSAPDNWAEDVNVGVAVAAMAGVGALSLALNQARLASGHRRDARTDSLTGLLNRRALFDMYSEGQLAPFTSVVIFDLDRFKAVNDTHGHAVGDEVLRRFADTLRAGVRTVDTVARLGGEEFALVLPRSKSEPALKAAERIRRAFADVVVMAGSTEIRCTVSAGVATAAGDEAAFADVLRSADDALYVAKRNGRDRVVAEPLRLVG